MYELIRTGEQSYYIDCPAKIGVYTTGDGAYLIDAGGDKDAGRRARKILDGQGWKLLGILVTHSNADHIGGCQYLQRQTGCRVFAPGIEAQFTRTPILEPSFLYGGFPPAALRHKFLLAAPCECEDAASPAFPQEVKVLPLPGALFRHVRLPAAGRHGLHRRLRLQPGDAGKIRLPLHLRRGGLPGHARRPDRRRREDVRPPPTPRPARTSRRWRSSTGGTWRACARWCWSSARSR